MKEVKKVPVYLFSQEVPQGEMFSFIGGKESEEYKKMLDDGWVDTPAKLDLPKNMDTGLTKDDVEKADPQHLKSILENYGFIVVTPEQMKAEATKMAMVAIDIENFSDDDIIAEAERRGLKESVVIEPEFSEIVDDDEASDLETEAEILLGKFKQDPKSLTKDEHIVLGRSVGAHLRSNWSEDVMIEKISEKLS